jgi:predicted phosphodiesterase
MRHLLPLLLFVALPWRAEAFDFALIGDMPYSATDSTAFPRLIEQVNRAKVDFVLHVGDIKGGSSSCADAALRERRDLFDRFSKPFLLVPGDNDWTDCHRQGAGAMDPLERLRALRRLYFTPPGRTLGKGSMHLLSQAADPAYREFPEHVRWTQEGVVFAALHIVGSRNATAGFEARTAANDHEVERRTAAALRWMGEAFEEAERIEAPGLFLAIHANPLFETHHDSTARAVYTDFHEQLAQRVMDFGRPVVLTHGDSHYFRIDKPLKGLSGRRLDWFTRVETFGSPHIHWIRVRVDPKDPMVFRFRQELIPQNVQNQ